MEQRFSATKMDALPPLPRGKENDVHEKCEQYYVKKASGSYERFDVARVKKTVAWAMTTYQEVDVDYVVAEALKNIFDGISAHEIIDALILAATGLIELDPAYGYLTAQLLLKKLFKEVIGHTPSASSMQADYEQAFMYTITCGVEQGIFDERMGAFDLELLAKQLVPERDNLFDYMGLRTLYERFFIKREAKRIELPQIFWMRVAMGLCYNELNRNEKAIEFYHLISTLRYVPSTPTLLHSGLLRPQLSSCFLTTVNDDLFHIFKCLGDNAQLAKFSGGIANDWTPLRSTGAMIKKINMESQGVIPFLKIANDVTAAISRSGSRRGASVVYLETWHLDIEDFLDLKRNTGDERRRTHDINTANWIPDLFIKRVLADEQWTLFSPHETSDLHELYGSAFEKRYQEYERMVAQGLITMHKTMPAVQLWRKMLSRLFETGHPWITFKDPCNIRSPQDHVGVVHSSNLCTEITLNTSADETAVCNLGSVNLARHIVDGVLDDELLASTVTTAMRMLDNVIDINFYPTPEARVSNIRHRPVGLGIMGFQDALYQTNINFTDPQAGIFADTLMEKISYHAIAASADLARERGAYQSYKGSKWDRNIFPLDTLALLEQERGMPLTVNRDSCLDWRVVRDKVQKYGMRNSNTMAIAPTATISTIADCFPCIEPIYKNMYAKSNMTGEFTVVNKYLVADLKQRGLWDQEIRDQLKYYDGSIQLMSRVPQDLKEKYKEVFEIDPHWLVQITALRAKWIDQSQSHNVFMKGVSGKLMSDIFIAGWRAGMKTFYYCRTLGATQIEKATLDAKKFGFTQKRDYSVLDSEQQAASEESSTVESRMVAARACNLSEDPSCDVCQ